MDIEVVSDIAVEAEVQTYTLVSDDIYVRRYDMSNVPPWYASMIESLISNSNTIASMDDVIQYLSTLESGYNTKFFNLETADTQTNALLSSLVSTTGGHTAAIASLDITKTDANSALAIAQDTVAAYFADGSAGAFFDSKISTYTSAVEANASNISVLGATLGNTSARVTTIEEVTITAIADSILNLATDMNAIIDAEVLSLQNQIDGNITTWFYTGEPTLVTTPASAWTDTTAKNQHLGDIYYDKATGYGYRFAHEDIDDSPDLGVIYTWIRITDTDVVKALADAATAQETADGKVTVHYTTLASRPALTALDVGDMWVSADVDTKGLTKVWDGDSWEDITNATANTAYTWSATASKLITGPDGSITGWEFSDGSNQVSDFKIKATNFSISDGTTGYTPFEIVDSNIIFKGKVSFNSVTDAPDLVAENTNINVSTNLVPNAGWGVGGHGDYQFVATPTYYRMLGAGTVAEDTLLLNVGDEVYTPYIADMTLSYKLSYSFKGAKIGSFITVVGTTPTSVDIIPAGVTVDPAKWYNVQIAVLPNGTTGGSLFGFIQESATLNIVSVISDVVLGATVEKFLMGFVATADTYISRVGIETITANTLSSVPVTAANLNTALASTNTVIDGGRITTGSVTANQIAAQAITSDKIQVEALYGKTIKGALIEGSVIRGSWIDYLTTGALSNWQYYTPSTVPALYRNNYAKDNTTGELVVDSQGYARLPATTTVYSEAIQYSRYIARYETSWNESFTISDAVISYDYDLENSPTKRVVRDKPRLTAPTNSLILESYAVYRYDTVWGGSRGGTSSSRCSIINTTVECIASRLSSGGSGTVLVNGIAVSLISGLGSFTVNGIVFDVVVTSNTQAKSLKTSVYLRQTPSPIEVSGFTNKVKNIFHSFSYSATAVVSDTDTNYLLTKVAIPYFELT